MVVEKFLNKIIRTPRPKSIDHSVEELSIVEEIIPKIPTRIKRLISLRDKKRFYVTEKNGFVDFLFEQAIQEYPNDAEASEIISRFFINGGSIPEDKFDTNHISSILGGNIQLTQSIDGSDLITCPSIQEAFIHGKQLRLGIINT